MTKKSKTIQFQIPAPCSESWDKMHSLPGGKFCDNCEKTVVDFSQMTDNELVRFFEKNDQQLCGRFRSDQLDKEIELPRVPTSFQKLKSIAAIAAGLLAWNTAPAQSILPQENISMVKRAKAAKGDKCQLRKLNKHFSKNKLSGIVKDQNGEILIGVNILLEKNNGTVTDIDGKFELEIPSDWESFEVTFSYIGFETQVIEFDKKDVLAKKSAEVKMLEASHQLQTLEVIGHKVQHKSVIMGALTGVSMITISEEKTKPTEKEHQPISNIYPNPFVDHVNVLLNLGKDQLYLFHLYNTNGQLIWAKTYDLPKGKQELSLDFSDVRMAQGSYFLRITDGNREIQTKKIIKVNMKGEEVKINSVQQ